MEILLAFVIFGLLGAITIYGYATSNRAARMQGRTEQSRPMAGVSPD